MRVLLLAMALLSACSSKPAPIPGLVVPAEPLVLAPTMPSDVVTIYYAKNPNAFMDDIARYVMEFPNSERVLRAVAMWRSLLERALHVSFAWAALDEPVRVAVTSPAKGMIMVLRKKSAVDAEELAPWQVNEVGDYVILSTSAELVPEHAAFVGSLAAWTPSAPVVLEASMPKLRAMFPDLISVEDMHGNAAMMKVVSTVPQALSQSDRVGLALEPLDHTIRATLSLTATDGSVFAGQVADLAKGQTTIGLATPEDAWASAYANGDLYLGLGDPDMLRALLLDPNVAKELPGIDLEASTAALARALDQAEGGIALWSRPDPGFPFAGEVVWAAKDGAALKADVRVVGEKLYGPIFKVATTPIGDGGDAVVLHPDWATAMKGDAPKWLRDAWGDHVELALASSPTFASMAIGAEAARRAPLIVRDATLVKTDACLSFSITPARMPPALLDGERDLPNGTFTLVVKSDGKTLSAAIEVPMNVVAALMHN